MSTEQPNPTPASKHDPRAEGVYVTSFVYPPQGGPQSTRLYAIERVYGDASVDRVQVTRDEAMDILNALQEQMARAA